MTSSEGLQDRGTDSSAKGDHTAWGLSPSFALVPPMGVALVCGARTLLSAPNVPPSRVPASQVLLSISSTWVWVPWLGWGWRDGGLLQLGGFLCPCGVPPYPCP